MASSSDLVDWGSGLPVGLLEVIVGKLDSLVDAVRFGAVCTDWNSATKYDPDLISIARARRERLHLLWNCYATKTSTWSLYNIAEKKPIRFRNPMPPRTIHFRLPHLPWQFALDDDSMMMPLFRLACPRPLSTRRQPVKWCFLFPDMPDSISEPHAPHKLVNFKASAPHKFRFVMNAGFDTRVDFVATVKAGEI